MRKFVFLLFVVLVSVRASASENENHDEIFREFAPYVAFLEETNASLRDRQVKSAVRAVYFPKLYQFLRTVFLVEDWLQGDAKEYTEYAKLHRKAVEWITRDRNQRKRRLGQQLLDLSASVDEIRPKLSAREEEKRALLLDVDSHERICKASGRDACLSNGTATALDELRRKVVETDSTIAKLKLDIQDVELRAKEISATMSDPEMPSVEAVIEGWRFLGIPRKPPFADIEKLDEWVRTASGLVQRSKLAREAIPALLLTRYGWLGKHFENAKAEARKGYGMDPNTKGSEPTKILDTIGEYKIERRTADGAVVYEGFCEFDTGGIPLITSDYKKKARYREMCGYDGGVSATEHLVAMSKTGEYAYAWTVATGCNPDLDPRRGYDPEYPNCEWSFRLPCYDMPCLFSFSDLAPLREELLRLDPFEK